MHNKVADVIPFHLLPSALQERAIRYWDVRRKLLSESRPRSSSSILMNLIQESPDDTTDEDTTPLRPFGKHHDDIPPLPPASQFKSIDELAKSIQSRVKEGDVQAWNMLYKAFLPYVTAITRHELYYYPDAVDDVANDVMNWLHSKGVADWDEGTGLMTWLKQVVKFKCMNWGEKYGKHTFPMTQIGDEHQDDNEEGDVNYAVSGVTGVHPDFEAERSHGHDLDPSEKVGRAEEVKLFMKTMSKIISELPEEESTVMNLSAFEGLTIKEIAAKLDWKESKVKSRLENARWHTREWLLNNPEMSKLMKFVMNG